MGEYVTLMGADDVLCGGRMMQSAAEQMSRAASQMDDTLERQRRFMEDWLQRFEAALASKGDGA